MSVKKCYLLIIFFILLLLSCAIILHGSFKARNGQAGSGNSDNLLLVEQKLDSLFRKSQSIFYTSPDSAIYYFEKALDLALDNGLREWESTLLNALGSSYLLQANYAKASLLLFEALHIAQQIESRSREARAYNNIGILNKELGNHRDALYFYIEASKLYDSVAYAINLARVLVNTSLLYLEIDNFQKAMEYAALGEKIFIEENNKIGIHAVNSTKSLIFLKMNEVDSSFVYIRKAIDVAIKDSNNYGLSNAYKGLGDIYFHIRAFDQAIHYYDKSKSIAQKFSIRNNEATANIGLSKVNFEKNNYESALIFALNALAISEDLENDKISIEVNLLLPEIYVSIGDFKSAYSHRKKANELKKKLEDQNNLHQIYSLEIKELNENMMLSRLEKQKKELLITRRNSLILAISLAFICITVMLILFITRIKYKQKVKMNQASLIHSQVKSEAALNAEIAERKRLGIELHDGLGPLLSLAKLNITSLIQKPYLSPERKFVILDHTVATVNELLREVKFISHNMAPVVLIEKGFESAVKNLVQKLNETKRYNVSLDISGLNGSLDLFLEHTLYRSLLEIVNNSIIHANGTEINLQIIQNDADLTVMVEDNGVGFDIENIYNTGLGLASTKSRLESVNGAFYIDSIIGRGTIVTMMVPLK